MFDRFKEGLKSIVDRFKYKELSEEVFEELRDDLLILLIVNDVSYEAAESILNEIKSYALSKRYE
jgi:signal recognition particle GTPase